MMDQADTKEVLLESAKEAFQTSIFMSIEETNEPDWKIIGPTRLATINFEGYVQGCLSLCCSHPCARAITVNLVALEPNDQLSEAQICNALGEVISKVMDCIKSRLKADFSNTVVSKPSVSSDGQLKNDLDENTVGSFIQTNLDGKYPIRFTFLYKNTTDLAD